MDENKGKTPFQFRNNHQATNLVEPVLQPNPFVNHLVHRVYSAKFRMVQSLEQLQQIDSLVFIVDLLQSQH